MRLDAARASGMARIALGHVTREYPHKLDHVLADHRDALTPREPRANCVWNQPEKSPASREGRRGFSWAALKGGGAAQKR